MGRSQEVLVKFSMKSFFLLVGFALFTVGEPIALGDKPDIHLHFYTGSGPSELKMETENGDNKQIIGTGDCPITEPALRSACATKQECNYGQECCCGKCYHSVVYQCMSGTWVGLHTDACLHRDC